MLTRSFQILTGVGPRSEMALWKAGILTWQDFLWADRVPGISPGRKGAWDEELRRAVRAYGAGEVRFFSRRLPTREYWRLLSRFRDDVAALDIETDGTHWQSKVSVVGIARGGAYTALIAGSSLSWASLRRLLEGAQLLLTFNGACFDLPFLSRIFPGAVPPIAHLDLRFLAKRVGLPGGLKLIEQVVGIPRSPEVAMLTGNEAVYLWKLWEADGNRRALQLLLDYNRYDALNLLPLADVLVARQERLLEAAVPSGDGQVTRETRPRPRPIPSPH